MTLINDSTYTRTSAPAWAPRTELEVAAAQLRAISAFNEMRRLQEEAATSLASSRELRMDAARTLEVLRRQHEAVVARTHEQLCEAGSPLDRTAQCRVVLAHRNAWFAGKTTHGLQQRGLQVVATVDNGADAIGLILAEQPDLVLVEDTLAMVPGEAVVREVRRVAPDTVVAAQVAYGDRVGQLLEAGASTVFTRRIPPEDVVETMLQLLSA